MSISAREYQNRLKKLTLPSLQNLVEQEVQKRESQVKILKEQDFLEGDIYGDGTRANYRSRNYELFKAQKNPVAGGAVDLILTGKFVESMYLLKQKRGRYLFGNRDQKRQGLIEKYGVGIFSLNQVAFSKFQKDFVQKPFIRNIKKYANIR